MSEVDFNILTAVVVVVGMVVVGMVSFIMRNGTKEEEIGTAVLCVALMLMAGIWGYEQGKRTALKGLGYQEVTKTVIEKIGTPPAVSPTK